MIKLIVAGALACASTCAFAQAQMPTCNGKMGTIRYSEIKPGQWALFEKAAKDNAAWYRAHKDATTVKLARVTKRDSKTGKIGYDDGAAMTITQYTPSTRPGKDAAWNAFVAEYKNSSTIKQEYRVCISD